jgi:hypothetical protein
MWMPLPKAKQRELQDAEKDPGPEKFHLLLIFIINTMRVDLNSSEHLDLRPEVRVFGR